jgi:hypothetical protein
MVYRYSLCNKKNTLDGFEGLQGLWTDGDGGWDFRPDRFFFQHFGFNHEKFTPPPLRETTQKLLEGGLNFLP